MPDKERRVWITWERQRRNRTLSAALRARLFEFDSRRGRYVRYAVAGILTLYTLLRERPRTVFVQNPSIVLAALAVAYCRLFRIPVVVDAHNAGLFPLEGRNVYLNRLSAILLRAADLTIVTNPALAAHVKENLGRAFVLPDPVPPLEKNGNRVSLRGRYNVFFVCTWAADEPYAEVIKAARLLDGDVVIYVSGGSKGKEKTIGMEIPANVVLTGYLSEDAYVDMLFACDVVVDLTTRENCLVCGAYEAVAAEKPLIVSDKQALRDYFVAGTLYTNNDSLDISQKITAACNSRERLCAEMKGLKVDMRERWEQQRMELDRALHAIRDGGRG